MQGCIGAAGKTEDKMKRLAAQLLEQQAEGARPNATATANREALEFRED